MKKIQLFTFFALIFCLTVGLKAQAQSSGIDRYFETYQQDDRFTNISVSSKMFGLFAEFDMNDPEQQELVETISDLKGLKMLIGNDVPDAGSIFKQALQRPKTSMEELMTIKETNRQFTFFITEENGLIGELLMIGYDEEKLVMMSLVGKIDLRKLSALSQKMDIQGFEYFQQLGK